MVIIGAGLSGLLAGLYWRDALILERSQEPTINQKALLRFRSPAIGDFTNIPFKAVQVRKAIYSDDLLHTAATIRTANLYTQKVLGFLSGEERSIWNLDPCVRYIAPDDFPLMLAERLKDRITYGCNVTHRPNDVVVSTAPMPRNLELVSIAGKMGIDRFAFADIRVVRFRLQKGEAYQTIYFPDPSTPVYRASITGNTLIVEMTTRINQDVDLNPSDMADISEAFGLRCELDLIEAKTQRYGKIAPIEERARREAIYTMSKEHRLYSLGRYAVWRNILLDDVLNDIRVINSLREGDQYTTRMKSIS